MERKACSRYVQAEMCTLVDIHQTDDHRDGKRVEWWDDGQRINQFAIEACQFVAGSRPSKLLCPQPTGSPTERVTRR